MGWQKQSEKQGRKDAKNDRPIEDECGGMSNRDYENSGGRIRFGKKGDGVKEDKFKILTNAWEYTKSEEDDTELMQGGVTLGYNSVNFEIAAVQVASIQYAKAEARWRLMPPEIKDANNAAARDRRANREWEKIRLDSINRKAAEHNKVFREQRTEDDPYWKFGDPEEIARMDGIDKRSARQIALRWRFDVDEKAWRSLVIKYCAWLEDVKPDSMRTRFKRKPHDRQLAEFVTSVDCMAVGVVMPGGFDKEALLGEIGDELAMEMNTPRSDMDRREFLISAAHDLYAGGSLFPPYVYKTLDEQLDDVVLLLDAAGVDMTPPEPEIDWSRV